MAADVTQNINYNYKTNVQTLTRYHDRFDQTLNKTVRTTQRLTKAMGTNDRYMMKNQRVTYQNAKATNQLHGSFGNLGKGMGGLALRFVGYNMILNQIMGAQQKLVEWVKQSITEFREFEKKMAEVSTIIGDLSEGSMPRLTAGVESLSIRFGKSATDMAKGLYDILSAAFDSEDAIRLLTTATKASIAGLSDVSTSVDIFTSVLNAYGMTASQAAHISDIFFQTIRRGKLVFEDLASAIGYVTPIAAAAGVEFEEIAAILATVTRMGLHVDMASRGLALTIQNIVSPTKQAADAAQEYNIDMSGLALRVKGLEGFMVELNKAVKEHGATILPEMIRNMRSLRVVMAVTSDEGIAGMTTDLDLMAKSAGQTEMAMSKMTAVTQMQVDILAQSMQYLERNIGEAWSGFDIWWKKTQLWWGTLLSGGDADRALKNYDARVLELKQSFLALLKTQNELAGKGTLMSEMLGKMYTPEMTKILDRMETVSPNITRIMEKAFEATKPIRYEKFVDNLIPWDSINQYMETEAKKREQSKTVTDLITEQLESESRIAEIRATSNVGTHEYRLGRTREVNTLTVRLQELDKEIKAGKAELMDYQTMQEGLQPGFDFLTAGIDDLSASMEKHKTNIIELQSAMDDLKISVLDTYTAMSGETFKGRLEWEIDVKETEIFIDRFNKFSAMAIKYGDEFSAIEWFDKDIWDMIDGIESYDGSMQDIINTLHNYSSATKELSEAQKKAKDIEDELAASIRKNNLAIMKIQLSGMMRRRGLTRTEQKTIKEIEIENAQFRIDQLTNTIDFEESIEQMRVDNLESQYDKAKTILDEYNDRANFNLYLLKDIRDDDINNLKNIYVKKEELLDKYVQWEKDELVSLGDEHNAYMKILSEIAERPDTDEMYKKLYGFYAAKESIAELERLRTFQKETGTTIAPPTTYIKPETITPKYQPGIFEKNIQDYLMSLRFPKYEDGISYVPQTQLAEVHRGERIIPAGENAGSGSITIEHLTIDVKQIAELDNIEKLGALLSSAQNAKILTSSGKTRYGLR